MAKTILRQRNLAVEQLLDDAEAVEAGHLHVEKKQVGIVLADEVDGFKAVFALRDDVDIAGILEQIGKFVARELFIIDDDGGKGHRDRRHSSFKARSGPECAALRESAVSITTAQKEAQGEGGRFWALRPRFRARAPCPCLR